VQLRGEASGVSRSSRFSPRIGGVRQRQLQTAPHRVTGAEPTN